MLQITKVWSPKFRALMFATTLVLGVVGAGGSMASGQTTSVVGASSPGAAVWSLVDKHDPEVQAAEKWIRPIKGQMLVLDVPSLITLFKKAPLEDTARAIEPMIVLLPDPDGGFAAFSMLESPIMEPGLAIQFPEIKTWVGQGIDDPAATLRADITPQGFHAQVLSPNGDWYIDPYSRADAAHYSSYYKRDLKNTHQWRCEFDANAQNPVFAHPDRGLSPFLFSGASLKTYRTAVACTGEYAVFHGGTVALAQAAIVTAMNRVTGVYEKELAIRLTLVASNTNVVFINSGTDPYTNTNGGTMLGQNQTRMDMAPPNGIGTANYDIGHVFSTGGGGVAGLGVVCAAGSKARGVTGNGSPVGDPFTIDYVAHEMGHQFGANHCFNGTGGSCAGGNRNASTAYEPGSASTIMGYAGICGVDDIQSNSDAYFHTVSYDEIRTFITSGGGAGCGSAAATTNNEPSVTGPGNFTIPKGTPFFLTASGTDPNGDALTYCWEERALGPAAALSAVDQATIPLTRSRTAVSSPTRFIPQLSTVLANTTDIREKLPSAITNRTWPWRVTVRDNRLNGGGVNSTNITLTVAGGAGPFAITSPVSAVTWAGSSLQTVTWNVNGTTANGVNCANVAIQLSTDGGLTFPTTIIASTPNDGTEAITVPNVPTTNGRIRVIAVGNIFYDINEGTITITAGTSVAITGSGVNTYTDTTGNGNSNSRIDPGETAIQLSVQLINTGTAAATGVSGTLVSNTGTVSVVSAASAYPNLSASGGTGSNATPFVLNVSAAHPCGDPISLRLNYTSAQASGFYDFALPTGLGGGSVGPFPFPYTGGLVSIPDNVPAGVTAAVAVSGLSGTIADVNFSIDGSACTNAIAATTVGLDHTWVGDLIATLTSPIGTTITLFNFPGSANNDGNNFCSTILDDAGGSSIDAVVNTSAPFSGSFTPTQALSAFNGQIPNGTWTLRVSDNAAQDLGTIRNFSIIFRTSSTPTCDPPVDPTVCPSITTGPANQSACISGSASFSVVAAGTPTLTYQWRKGVVNLTNGPGIAGADSPTLMLSNIVVLTGGSYNCVVSNACVATATSGSATLSVCIADFNCVNGITVQDIFDFLAAWFAADPRADVNGANGVTVQDIFDFLAAWFIGVCP